MYFLGLVCSKPMIHKKESHCYKIYKHKTLDMEKTEKKMQLYLDHRLTNETCNQLGNFEKDTYHFENTFMKTTS